MDATVWVDADACPRPVRDILCRAAIRCSINTVFIANHSLTLQASLYISSWQVEQGFDQADNAILARVGEQDLVVSGDIPLAAAILAKAPGVTVLSPHGEVFNISNIQSRLAMRNLMESMRNDYGQHSGGKPAFDSGDSKAFADRLDAYLAARGR